MEIRKRNGESVPFQQEKIFNAMKKAFDGQGREIGSRELNEILAAVLDNLAAAALALAVYDLLVCENYLTGGAPVYIHFLLVCQSVLKQLKEYPLRPLEIPGVGGIYLTLPVKGHTE